VMGAAGVATGAGLAHAVRSSAQTLPSIMFRMCASPCWRDDVHRLRAALKRKPQRSGLMVSNTISSVRWLSEKLSSEMI
jgi:hypothetical protein